MRFPTIPHSNHSELAQGLWELRNLDKYAFWPFSVDCATTVNDCIISNFVKSFPSLSDHNDI